MNEEKPPISNSNIDSNESKIQVLKARKTELVFRKELTKNPDEISRIENLLKEVEELIHKHHLSTTIRRRMKIKT
jgi:hypothetical protein